MMPGLQPGLLRARRAQIVLNNVPDSLFISTGGGPGVRQLNLFVTVSNAPGPYFFEFSIDIVEFSPSPASGSGNSASPFVGFSSNIFYDGPEMQLQEVGTAFLRVQAADGTSISIFVPVLAGQ